MKFIQANGSATDFVDSNVWLYALASGQDARKESTARKLLKAKRFAISLQVINEVSVNLIKKHGAAETAVQKLIRSFYRKHFVVETDKDVLLAASKLRVKYSLSF